MFLCITAFFLRFWTHMMIYLLILRRKTSARNPCGCVCNVYGFGAFGNSHRAEPKTFQTAFTPRFLCFATRFLFIGRMIILKILSKYQKITVIAYFVLPELPRKIFKQAQNKNRQTTAVLSFARTPRTKLADSAVKAIDESNQILIFGKHSR
ncbi:MAG: hypothetical protein L6V93_09465 [Clostridiales bacterium]|nr:MAG: hypothetical protein L6V93_09465 [Clostridiales bacterium]